MDCVAALRRDFPMVPDNSTCPSAAIATLRNPSPLEVVNSLIARRVVFWESPP